MIEQNTNAVASDVVVFVGSSYAVFPTSVGDTPYSWWSGIHNPPAVYIYLEPNTAFNTQSGIAAIAAILAFVSLIPGVNLLVGIAGGVAAIRALDYTTVYQGDQSSDGSLSLWLPIDWYNVNVGYWGQHEFYIATPRYWWLILPFWAYRWGNR
jgi:hypothetical protein